MRSKKVRRQEDKQKDKGKKKWWGREAWYDCVLMKAGLGNNALQDYVYFHGS